MNEIAPWEVVSSVDGVLHLQASGRAGWVLLAVLLGWAGYTLRRALRGERRLRAGRFVAGAVLALCGLASPLVLVWTIDLEVDGTAIRWRESRPPGREVRAGELARAELAEVGVGSYVSRGRTRHRLVLRARDGTEHLPDPGGSDAEVAEGLVAVVRDWLATPR